jgi:AraC-like DNA-binding protein
VHSFLVYNSYLDILKEEVMAKNTDMLMQVQRSIDQRLEELIKISMQIDESPDLTRRRVEESTVNRINAIDALRNYSFTNDFFEEVLLYFRGDDYLFSSAGTTYRLGTFIKQHYQFEQWGERDFLRDLNATRAMIHPVQEVTAFTTGTDEMMTYVVPLPFNSSAKTKTVVFLVRNRVLTSMLEELIGGNDGNVIIIDDDSQIVTSLHERTYIEGAAFSQAARRAGAPLYSQFDVDGVRHLVASITSPRTDWTYVTVVPEHSVIAPVLAVKNRSFLSILLIVVLSGASILYIMRLNYTPIRKLKSFAETRLDWHAPESDEIEFVRNAVEGFSDATQRITEQVLRSRPAMRESLVLQLLKGRFPGVEEFNARGRDYGLVLPNGRLAVVLFYLRGHERVVKTDLIAVIERVLGRRVTAYGRETFGQDQLVVVAALPNGVDEVPEDILAETQRELRSRFGARTTVGVGNAYEQCVDVPKSYIEAHSALGYRLVKGLDSVIRFREIDQTETLKLHYPQEELDELELSLLQMDPDSVHSSLVAIVSDIKERDLPLFMARQICYDVINTVIRTLVRFRHQLPQEELEYINVMDLTEFETVEELEQLVEKMAADIAALFKTETENAGRRHVARLVAYLEESYTSNQFTVQGMADHFGFSISSLSRYFKAQTGETISECVNKLRIGRSKELLVESDDKLEEIARQVGYVNVATFIRSFKATTGTTPGSFRKAYAPALEST